MFTMGNILISTSSFGKYDKAPIEKLVIVTLFFLSFGNLISLWIRGFSGRIIFITEEWLSILIAALIWPIFMRLLQMLQNYFVED